MVFFGPFFTNLDGALETFVETAANNLVPYLNTATTLAATIVLILFGLQLSLAATEIPIRKLLGLFLTIAVVSLLATVPGNYLEYIGQYLMGLPSDVAVAVTGPPAVDIGSYMDTTFGAILEGVALIYKKGGIADMGILFAGLLLYLAVCALLVSATIAICIGKVGLALVVALGPIFIFFLLTPWTKDFFTRWLSYALQFTVLQALIGGTLLIAQTLIDKYVLVLRTPTWEFNDLMPILSPIIIMLVLTYLFGQLPSMASSLTGGIGLAMGNAAWSGVTKAAGAGGWLMRKGAGAAGRGIAAAGNAGANWGLGQLGMGGNAVSQGGAENSVSQGGSGAQAQNAIMRGQRTQGNGGPPKDAPRTPAQRSSASAIAFAKMQEEMKKQNNGQT